MSQISAARKEEQLEYSAEMLFSMIGDREHAVKRPKDHNKDRRLRNKVEMAQLNGERIINEGYGYYRADLSKPEEAMAYRRYVRGLKSRAVHLFQKARAMEASARNINQLDILDLLEGIGDLDDLLHD